MARRALRVTVKPAQPHIIPDAFIEGAAIIADLTLRDLIQPLAQRLQIRRQGGYCALDVFLFLLIFFTADIKGGIQNTWKHIRPVAKAIAALAGRKNLPSPSSLSRALRNADTDLFREHTGWILRDLTQTHPLLKHPQLKDYDAHEKPWQTFDLDPSSTVFYHRPLPQDDDLPQPERLAHRIATPGHTGRKRGTLLFRKNLVQHAPSGIFTHAHLSAGKGQRFIDFTRCLDSIVETCSDIGHPIQQAIARMDGEYGHVPYFTACRDRNLPFITRLNRRKLAQSTTVLRKLRKAQWSEVPDSLAGPRRFACELGVLTIHPGKQTRKPDGTRYDPINIRVVATRFKKTRAAKRGFKLESWQVELFAVDLPGSAWPAAEAITSYFARCGQENRFAQEDREIGLDRISSYHPAGQELAVLAGLCVWNLRIVRGFEAHPPPAQAPVQRLRTPSPARPSPSDWPPDPAQVSLFGEVDWKAMLRKRVGWSFDDSIGAVMCADGRPLFLTTVRGKEHSPGRTGVIFCRPKGGCQACSHRAGCLRSGSLEVSKHAEFSFPTALAERLRSRLTALRAHDVDDIEHVSTVVAPGPLEVHSSLFLPGRARQVFRERFAGGQLQIEVEAEEVPGPLLLAEDIADRQRRRKSWAQHRARYALPDNASIHITVSGVEAFTRMFSQSDAVKDGLQSSA